MANHYGYSIQDLEDIYPFERDIYVTLLNNYNESKKQENRGSQSDYEAYMREFTKDK